MGSNLRVPYQNHLGMVVIEPLGAVIVRSGKKPLMICIARCLEDRIRRRGRWAVAVRSLRRIVLFRSMGSARMMGDCVSTGCSRYCSGVR
jgi:hypothetical protein